MRFAEDAGVIPTTVKRRSFVGARRFATGVGASCQLNATPAKDWNHGSSCGYESGGEN